ncbi:TadA family conjugal transfer-associated ATPase [Arthrobacter sp. 35W]|uniref:TadA family conjugal transfer-associated ATPase n=1 Tax=Arthrobacter sp. 35W TaxID=1132441 RepID=UPI0006845B1E|nr:TadA family conjugal transfer-associated ATPase [Arthrobacter sp. 35W]
MTRRLPVPAEAVDEDLLDTVRQSVLAQNGPVTALRVATAVRDSGRLLGAAGSLAAVERISAELNGLGPLQPLLKDPHVTDIFVNAPDSVWLDRGGGPEPAGVAFAGEPALRALAVRLIAAGGRRLDDSSPCADVKLDGGFRVHAVLPPVSAAGTLLSIRVRNQRPFTLAGLVSSGFVHPQLAPVLEALVAARLSFLISGATGSGKTTLLATLLGLCGPSERLVLIEDAAELEPDHPHVLTLETRHANAEGTGRIDLAELVRQALRMNPSRLVVGECRGAEVRELLAALNTGHSGAGSTMHANSAADVPARLAALGVLAGLDSAAIALQAASAVDVVLHVERGPAGRRLAQLAVVALSGTALEVVPALSLEEAVPDAGRIVRGPGWEALQRGLGAAAILGGGGAEGGPV